MKAKEEAAYYDMLYEFTGIVTRANEMSFEGWEPERIAKKLKKALDAFLLLCMSDSIVEEKKKKESKKKSENDKKIPEAVEEKPPEGQQRERIIPSNFLRIDEKGWGLCPVCSSKVLKVTSVTRLENFPVYCKRCRADHLVNWWNANNQRILYKRYVNDRYIREQALKGTGLKSFLNTGSSATERAAMRG